MDEEKQNHLMNISIQSLPNELLTIILKNNDCRDIINFGATCKQFNQLVENTQYLWKEKFKTLMPENIFHIVESDCDDGNWFKEIKTFFYIKKNVYDELILMSPKYYWRTLELNIQDVRPFFTIALSNHMSYYYTVRVLQDIIIKGNQNTNRNCGEIPYTFTDMYYAKIIIRHLMQSYLAVKWEQKHMMSALYPDILLNFFIQWTDVANYHTDEDVESMITNVVNQVEMILIQDLPPNTTPDCSMQEKCLKGLLSEKKVLAAISNVLYSQMRMTITDAASLDTLDMVKVLHNKSGNMMAVASIYHAIARRFGVHCEVKAFPSHFFLEWQDVSDSQCYKIDLHTGALLPRLSCPFSNGNRKFTYKPELYMQFICTAFATTMGALNNWYTRNVKLLLDFLNRDVLYNNPFKNYHQYLREGTPLPTLPPININYLQDEFLELIKRVSYIYCGNGVKNVDKVVKKRDGRVRYAVGMICTHKKHQYVCVIRSWNHNVDPNLRQLTENKCLEFGLNQPFYDVIAADQTNRYVAQENLIEVMHPTRLYHLEDILARHFTHYNGFSYVPNNEKQSEYPDDGPVLNFYYNRARDQRRVTD